MHPRPVAAAAQRRRVPRHPGARTYPPSWTGSTPPTWGGGLTAARPGHPHGRTGVQRVRLVNRPSFAGRLDTAEDQNLVTSTSFQAAALNGALPAFSGATPGGPTFTGSSP